MQTRVNYIKRLIDEGEGFQLDFKFEISDASKIARTFVAFANTDGGKLLIGVRDDGTIAGVRSEEEKFMAEKAATQFCRPCVDFSSKEWTVDKKIVLEISVPKGFGQPYMALNDESRWKAYIRVNDQNIVANRILVKALRRKNSNSGTYIAYTENEKTLLEYLEKNGSITLSKFTKIAGISVHRAETILVNFMALGLIQQKIEESGIYYVMDSAE